MSFEYSQNPKKNKDPFLTNERAAEYLGVSPRTTEKWRCNGEGPKYTLIGKRPMYRVSSLEEYIESRQRWSTSDQGITAAAERGR